MSARRRIAEYGSEREHREVHRLVLRAVAIALVTAAGAAWLAAKGPVKVIIGTREIDEIAPTWYMLAAFPVLGMLLADVLDAALERGGVRGGVRGLFAKRTVVLGASVALLVVVSNLRLGIRLPISGHVLLMTYFLGLRCFARRIALDPVARPAVVERRIELGVVLALFAAVPRSSCCTGGRGDVRARRRGRRSFATAAYFEDAAHAAGDQRGDVAQHRRQRDPPGVAR
jgi:hypothetical protein